MNFITKLDFTVDLEKMREDLDDLLVHRPWPEEDFVRKFPGNQLGISYRKGAQDPWLDAQGNLWDNEKKCFVSEESDFSEINSLVGDYTKSVLKRLEEVENTKLGRIRYMKADSKRGLSVHKDFDVRYHFVLYTNPYSYFIEDFARTGKTEEIVGNCYHLPADGYCYKVDTTRNHTIYNGGWEPRIHLVICKA